MSAFFPKDKASESPKVRPSKGLRGPYVSGTEGTFIFISLEGTICVAVSFPICNYVMKLRQLITSREAHGSHFYPVFYATSKLR